MRNARQCGRSRINGGGFEFHGRSCCVRMPVGIMGTRRGKGSVQSAGGNGPEPMEAPIRKSGTVL